MRARLSSPVLAAFAALASASCNETPPNPPATGALVRVTTSSQVGVLLEDFPAASRDRVADEILAKPAAFWTEQAMMQLRLTDVRLVYRKYYFDEAEQDSKNALTLPPEEVWQITLDPAGAQRSMIDGHDVVVIGYSYESVLVTDEASPGISEPMLGTVGGTWDEVFTLPVDPMHILQRTGTACLTEDQFPDESLDAEDAFRFYDDTCEALDPICHHTQPIADMDCVAAVEAFVGRTEASIHYERIAWDDATADEFRSGELTTTDAPDLKVLTTGEGLNDNRVKYKYIPADHCAVIDGCVKGSGWRRLLAFDSHDHNVGGQPLHIGPVDYYNEGLGGELIDHNVYEFSDCHSHYHFKYYGSFYYGDETTANVQKMGFCLETTDRLSNNESTPLHTEYDCSNQGVAAGWGDLYGASLVCNWVDITDLDTSGGPVTEDLVFRSNPDGFLCEGTLTKDANGEQVWETTSFVSDTGAPVDKPACEEAPNVEGNDEGRVAVTIPVDGGRVTQPCASEHEIGPLRNCGFAMQPVFLACTPGQPVTVTCTGGSATQPQAVRLCETSAVLGTGVDCAYQDALGNAVVEGPAVMLDVTCPAARDAMEPGGQIAVYTAAAWEPDGSVTVTCN